MRVKIKRSEAPNTIIKYQTLFYTGPETAQSLEWSQSASSNNVGEVKNEYKSNNFGFVSDPRSHVQNMLSSTTNVRLPPPRVAEAIPVSHNSRSASFEREAKKRAAASNGTGFSQLKKMNHLSSDGISSPKLMNHTSMDKSPPHSSNASRAQSYKNLSALHISASVKKKLNWHVDQEALLNSRKFKDLIKSVRDTPYLDDTDSRAVTASMMHLKSYFESLLQRLFNENKSRFTTSSFFRALFAEEFSKEHFKRGPQTSEDLNRPTPVIYFNDREAQVVLFTLLIFLSRRGSQN